MMKDGTPFRSSGHFTCKAQADGFKELLEEMASRPQDYVSDHGRVTTNTVEGFHGLALRYRDKRTDLEHSHYIWTGCRGYFEGAGRVGQGTAETINSRKPPQEVTDKNYMLTARMNALFIRNVCW